MEYRTFAESYNPVQRFHPAHEQATSHLGGLNKTGQLLGHLLHGYLMGETLSFEEAHETVTGYTDIYRAYHPTIERLRQADMITDQQTAARAGAGNFYTMTGAMMPLWSPILYGFDLSPQQRQQAITVSQTRLALDGLAIAHTIHNLATTKDDEYEQNARLRANDHAVRSTPYRLFSEQHKDQRAWLTGYGNEVDAAIVLIEAVKSRPSMTVVPAPPQFEAGKHENNADFIVLDTEKRQALGIQVKSSIAAREVLPSYDPGRIVLLDGDGDLDNLKTVRFGPYRSATITTAWPGLISLEHFDRLKTYGKDAHLVTAFGYTPQQVMRWKMHLKQKLGKLPKRIPIATQRIRQRIDIAMNTQHDLAS